MNLIIYDYEVFAHDTLMGAKVITPERVYTVQTWDLEEIKSFYEEQIDSIWIGHNNSRYDNFIHQAVILGYSSEKIKQLSESLICDDKKRWLRIKLNWYDVMSAAFTSLKVVQAVMGKKISESKVNFNLTRPLTDEEKKSTEEYNRDDLEQTTDNFFITKGNFELRMNIITEFGLPLDALHWTGTQVAEAVLNAKQTSGIENWVVKPTNFEFLKLKNSDVLDYYMTEKFKMSYRNEYSSMIKTDKSKINKKLSSTGQLLFEVCGVKHALGSGGLHGARKNWNKKSALYFDVSGYYNLIMINLDLLPRSIPDESKKLYKRMYERQLELKYSKDPKEQSQRWVYKVILLSVFGAMTNKHCKFYDPCHGELVTIIGQIFLVDLLEKLEGIVELGQSNTDGIIATPLDGYTENDVKQIVDEWQERTGFKLSFDKITDIHQRDVNYYMYRQENGKIKCLGDIKHFENWANPFNKHSFSLKEAPVIYHAIVEYWMDGKLPEEVIGSYQDELRMFQYVCKPNSYDYLEYELSVVNEDGTITKDVERLQHVNRAFALKAEGVTGTIIKKLPNKQAKVACLPESVFVYNEEILSDDTVKNLKDLIDYDYYVKRSYELLSTHAEVEKIKDIRI